MSDQPEKVRYPRALALSVVRDLLPHLEPGCELLKVAGSLRRGRADVGDVEFVFLPRYTTGPREDFLMPAPLIADTDAIFARLIADGILGKRLNALGSAVWGEKNKLAVHAATGVPVDLFTATKENFANYLVCRTGGARMNVMICNAAIAKGWKWNPYGEGFSRHNGLGREIHVCASEREVFEFVGLEYREPEARP